MVGKVAQVVLETTTELRSELIPHEREALFQEADSVFDARILFLESNALSRSDNDFLDFFGPELARVRQVEVLLPQDTECSHDGSGPGSCLLLCNSR